MKLDQSYFPLDRVVRLGIIKFKNGQPFLPPHAQSPSEILWLTLFPPKEPLIIIAHKKKRRFRWGHNFLVLTLEISSRAKQRTKKYKRILCPRAKPLRDDNRSKAQLTNFTVLSPHLGPLPVQDRAESHAGASFFLWLSHFMAAVFKLAPGSGVLFLGKWTKHAKRNK